MNIMIEEIEPGLLSRLDSFSCGNSESDQDVSLYVKESAYRHHCTQVSRTFIALAKSEELIIGYISLYAGTMKLPKSFTKERDIDIPSIPVVILGRLAVHENFRRQGHGDFLLSTALSLAITVSKSIGVAALALHSYKEPSGFYEYFGFKYVRSQPWKDPDPLAVEPMYLSLIEAP